MSNIKLLKPLFVDGMFNAEGKKMQVKPFRTITNGGDTYELWTRAGKPDVQYPRADTDQYLLHVEMNGYLVPLRETEFSLVDHCGYPAACEELYGGKEAREEFFSSLRKSDRLDDIPSYIAKEQEAITRLGSEEERQVEYISDILNQCVATYEKSKANSGQTFPDFIGAIVLDDLDTCTQLSKAYREALDEQARKEKAERRAKAEAECREMNRIAEEKITDAIRIVKDGGRVENEPITICKTVDDRKTIPLVTCLMRKYNISVPIRTQGWINDKLASVTFPNEAGDTIGLTYAKVNNRPCSGAVFSYLSELMRVVREPAVSN